MAGGFKFSASGWPQLPEDFRIGPLTDQLTPGSTERRILKVSTSFMEGLSAGAIVEEAVLPEAREELRRSLQYYIDQGLLPRQYRFGAIYLDQETGALTPDGAKVASRPLVVSPA